MIISLYTRVYFTDEYIYYLVGSTDLCSIAIYIILLLMPSRQTIALKKVGFNNLCGLYPF